MKDTRPVTCYICRRKMYYSEHPKNEPEFKMDVDGSICYIHQKCLRRLRKEGANK